MHAQLRDDYLDEVAAHVRSAIETAAVVIGSHRIEGGELRFGETWESMKRLRLRLDTDQDRTDFVAVVADLTSTLATRSSSHSTVGRRSPTTESRSS